MNTRAKKLNIQKTNGESVCAAPYQGDLIDACDIERTFVEGDVTTHVLKGISLSINQGEFVAIMGKSGAGKSTLMYQLSVLDHPTAGSIIIDGINVSALTEQEQTKFRLNTLGYVFQDYALVPDLNTTENIMIPLLMKGLPWDEAKYNAKSALDAVGLPQNMKIFPHNSLEVSNNVLQ
jgi:putative ABC transport system ATP-binding protein